MTQEIKGVATGMYSKNTVIVYTIIACVVGIGIGWLVFTPSIPSSAEEKTEETSSVPLVLLMGNGLIVEEQSAGNSVVVKSVSMAQAGWVAIHEDAGGVPGKVLGARWFPQGESSGTIELLRPTVENTKYYAVLHSDNSDKEGRIFDSKVNLPLLDESGKQMFVTFMTAVIPSAQ